MGGWAKDARRGLVPTAADGSDLKAPAGRSPSGELSVDFSQGTATLGGSWARGRGQGAKGQMAV